MQASQSPQQTSPAATEQNPQRSMLMAIMLFATPPLLWAGNFIVGKAISNQVIPADLTLVRWIIGLCVMLPLAIPALKRDWRKYRRYPLRILATSLSGITAFSLLVYTALHHTSGTNGLLLNSFIPVLILLFSALFYGARLRLLQVVGLLISFAGVFTIVFKGDPAGLLALAFSEGDLLLLAAMVSFAFYTLWLKQIPADIDRLGLLCVQVCLTLIVVAPMSLLQHSLTTVTNHWDWTAIQAVAFIGVGPSFLSYIFYSHCVGYLGAEKASLSIHLIPVFGVVLSVLFLGEQVHGFHLAGIAAILVGIAICNRKTAAKQS
ncbi:DMT family transporter [Oceanobacter mangrovi]|uniref:DMT family transporter n=1 Tax=Oceanobacter mangrovi TaxID=2862510 RepID=UPI001C8E120A|nr:DMT family transporter [Oceanobacter mangrovi]